jgi:hypothetical protein
MEFEDRVLRRIFGTNKGTRMIVTLRFGSGFGAWQWTLL